MRVSILLVMFVLLCVYKVQYAACQVSDRYTKNHFTVTKLPDIQYGTATNYLGIQENLRMDIFIPENDTLTKRPLVLFFFGGAFMIGDKSHADMQTWCDSLASHGYVCAAVNYRIGLNPTNAGSAERAVYRAVQDARAAVRFFHAYHDVYGVDTSRVFFGGNSAGAITSLHTAFIDDESKRPASTFANPLMLWPDLGCLDCSGNQYQHTVDIKGVINLWGAVGDTAWMEAGETTALLTIHGTEDPIVPFTEGVPFSVGYTFPYLYGAVPLNHRADQIDIYHEFYPYEGLDHSFYGLPDGIVTFPNEYWQPVFEQGRDFLYKLLQYETGDINGAETVCQLDTFAYTVSGDADWDYCWDISGGSIIGDMGKQTVHIVWDSAGQQSLQAVALNENLVSGLPSSVFQVEVDPLPQAELVMDIQTDTVFFQQFTDYTYYSKVYFPETGEATFAQNGFFVSPVDGLVTLWLIYHNHCRADTIKKYGIVHELTQVPEDTISTGLIDRDLTNRLIVNVYPNPLTGDLLTIEIETASQHNQPFLKIYDMYGKEAKSMRLSNQKTTISIDELPSALYFLHFLLEDKILVKKLIKH